MLNSLGWILTNIKLWDHCFRGCQWQTSYCMKMVVFKMLFITGFNSQWNLRCVDSKESTRVFRKVAVQISPKLDEEERIPGSLVEQLSQTAGFLGEFILNLTDIHGLKYKYFLNYILFKSFAFKKPPNLDIFNLHEIMILKITQSWYLINEHCYFIF